MLKKLSMVVSVLALLALVLAGCANGMLREDEATVNGYRNSSGSRTVTVTVTNFAPVNGPMRTIAPEQIGNGDLDKHIFVVTGSSHYGTMEAQKVTIDQTTGRFELTNLDPDIWTIKLTAYDKTKLFAGNLNEGSTGDEIVKDTNSNAARVLVGSAAVDLTGRNSTAKITLTPRGIDGNGTVELTINLHPDDRTQIPRRNLKVKVGIYNKVTGLAVGNSEKDNVGGNAPINYTADGNEIPAGLYTFRVEIYDDAQGATAGPWQYTDEIYFEPNRPTNDTIEVPKLIGEEPGKPTNFAAYWYKDSLNNPPSDKFNPQKDTPTYIVTLAWDRDTTKGNEKQFEIQFTDLTSYYNPKDNTYHANGYNPNAAGNGENINSGSNLWEKFQNDETKFTTIDLETLGNNEYPLYVDDGKGSIIGGSSEISFEVPAGRVYSARIRAKNAEGDSEWEYLGKTDVQNKPTDSTLLTKGDWVFDVFAVTYKLDGKMLLKNGEQATVAKRGEVDYAEYDKNTGYTVKYKAYTNGATADEYLLFPEGFAGPARPDAQERIQWTQWIGDDGGSYDDANAYEGHTNVTLTPNASGEGSTPGGVVDIESSGTFATGVTAETIFVKTVDNTNTPYAGASADKLSGKGNPGNNPGIGYTAGTKTVKLVLPKNPQTGKGTDYFLQFAIGTANGNFELDKVNLSAALDGSARTGKVDSAKYTIETKQGATLREAKSSPGTSVATLKVGQLPPGEYILRVSTGFTSGYSSSPQFILDVSYTP